MSTTERADSDQLDSEQRAADFAGEPVVRSPSPAATRDERFAAGKALREKTPRSAHAGWQPPADRRDPIELLVESSEGRLPELTPIRYGRMVQSPFAFFRGAAAIMAADLARTPTTDLRLQACGDCHLLNFGGFATPERRLVFDINDFDETLRAPWEWDLKRLAASFVIAGRHNGYRASESREATTECVASYREHMAEFAKMRALDVWYARIDLPGIIEQITDKEHRAFAREQLRKTTTRSVVEHDFPKLCSEESGVPRIRDNPPLIFHAQQSGWVTTHEDVHHALARYRESLSDERRVLLDRYELYDVAIKVVGVGSVGTRCGIALLMAGPDDPLFLQVKEARKSVLEPYVGAGHYSNQGHRVVVGQRLMQSASDLFLGWTEGREGRHFYLRQLRDMKIKPRIELYEADIMAAYGRACGWALGTLAHARTADTARIAGYLGTNDRFDEALADFAEAYADQNEQDHDALVKAVRAGRLEAFVEE